MGAYDEMVRECVGVDALNVESRYLVRLQHCARYKDMVEDPTVMEIYGLSSRRDKECLDACVSQKDNGQAFRTPPYSDVGGC